jgi:hypothetical protein
MTVDEYEELPQRVREHVRFDGSLAQGWPTSGRSRLLLCKLRRYLDAVLTADHRVARLVKHNCT